MHEAVLKCKAECEFCYENVWCIYRLFYVLQVIHTSPCFVCTYAHTKDVQQCECKKGSSKTCCQQVALKSLHSQDNKPKFGSCLPVEKKNPQVVKHHSGAEAGI